MKIALAQFNPTVGDFAGNSARILEMANEAKRGGADLAVFSELCVCGYLPLDLLERPAFLDRNRAEGSCVQTIPGRGYRFVAPVTRTNPGRTALADRGW